MGGTVTAIRSVRIHEGKFVQISNAALQDRRLTAAARGVLAFVLSLPPDQRFTAEWLVAQMPDGERAIRSALRNLEQSGYFRRTRASHGGTWTWDQVISDEPVDNPAPMAFPQVSASGKKGGDAPASSRAVSALVIASAKHARDAKRGNKDLKTEDPNTKDEDRVARAREADPPVDNSGPMTDMIISEIEERTRVRVSRDHAAQVARQILGRASSPPRRPLVFVRAAIRREENPQNFVPTNTPPPYRAAPVPARPPVDADPWVAPPRDQGGDLLPLGAGFPAFARERMTR